MNTSWDAERMQNILDSGALLSPDFKVKVVVRLLHDKGRVTLSREFLSDLRVAWRKTGVSIEEKKRQLEQENSLTQPVRHEST